MIHWSRLLPIFAAVLVAGTGLAATLALHEAAADEQRRAIEELTLHELDARRDALEAELGSRMAYLTALHGFVAGSDEVTAEEFRAFATLLVGDDPVVRSIQLAPDAIVTYVEPRDGNEAAIGHDLLADPARREVVLRTIETREAVVEGPYPLVQGGSGILARLALFKPGPDPDAPDVYWGLAVIVLDSEVLLDAVGIRDESGERVGILLEVPATSPGEPPQRFGDLDVLERGPVAAEVVLPSGTWLLRAAPQDGWPSVQDPLLSLVPGTVASLGMATVVFLLASEPSRLRAQVRAATAKERASQARLAAVVETAHEGIVTADAMGVIVAANQGAARIFGYEAGSLVGRRIEDLMPERFAEAHNTGMQSFLRTGETQVVGRTVELVGRRADGTEFPVELSLATWTDPSGPMFTGIVRDISERKEAEAERRASAEQFEVAVGALSRAVGQAERPEAVAEQLALGAMRLTRARAVAVAGPERVLALEARDEESSRVLRDRMRENPERLEWIDANLPGSRTGASLLLLMDPGGRSTEDEARKVAILCAQAALSFHRAEAIEDVQTAYESLDRTMRERQVYLDILTHDLKNPLAIARGRAELTGLRHPEAASDLAVIEHSLERASTILERSALYARLEQIEAIEVERIDLAELARKALDALRPLASERSVHLEYTGPTSLPWTGTPLFSSAVENIVSNAIKWSPDGASVEVYLDRGTTPEGAMELRVIDHGAGIPEHERGNLFERFSRGSTGKGSVTGTGLGLAIARRIVGILGGTIEVTDTLGGGATFTILLPGATGSPPPRPGDRA